MERATVKTVLIVVGSAIGGILVFIAVVAVYIGYKFSELNSPAGISFPSRPRSSEEVISTPPEIKERFLGTQGSYSGSFPHDRNKVLATGPGRITGRVTSSGKPVQGLRLRLALNDGVMSEWATTDAAGKYAIGLPYGKYRIDGYNLDYSVVDAVLGGKTDSPQNNQYRSDDIIVVADGKAGRGPDLEYVDPVRKKGPRGEVSLSKPVILEWEPYPAAATYQVQITEAQDPRDYATRKQLFECCRGPSVSGTSFNLSERGTMLKKGYSYFFDITALDEHGKMLADSAGRQMRPDFVTTD
ncbi:MAG TPA: carboxypeptidase-like regulatory domain-containing protein [Burkholderiales bacterium]|nr:carboxypeptidase-like regulatory domain-containing protein [Burkholderiales bacterium]